VRAFFTRTRFSAANYQFHPEKNNFVFNRVEKVDHSEWGVRLSQHLANGFVAEVRKSDHKYPSERAEMAAMVQRTGELGTAVFNGDNEHLTYFWRSKKAASTPARAVHSDCAHLKHRGAKTVEYHCCVLYLQHPSAVLGRSWGNMPQREQHVWSHLGCDNFKEQLAEARAEEDVHTVWTSGGSASTIND
jgi:hypothetical protein